MPRLWIGNYIFGITRCCACCRGRARWMMRKRYQLESASVLVAKLRVLRLNYYSCIAWNRGQPGCVAVTAKCACTRTCNAHKSVQASLVLCRTPKVFYGETRAKFFNITKQSITNISFTHCRQPFCLHRTCRQPQRTRFLLRRIWGDLGSASKNVNFIGIDDGHLRGLITTLKLRSCTGPFELEVFRQTGRRRDKGK